MVDHQLARVGVFSGVVGAIAGVVGSFFSFVALLPDFVPVVSQKLNTWPTKIACESTVNEGFIVFDVASVSMDGNYVIYSHSFKANSLPDEIWPGWANKGTDWIDTSIDLFFDADDGDFIQTPTINGKIINPNVGILYDIVGISESCANTKTKLLDHKKNWLGRTTKVRRIIDQSRNDS